MHYSIDLKELFLPGHSLMKANSLPLNTSILKDKARVLRWRDLTLPIQIPHLCQARSNSPSADTDDKCPCISRGWDVEASNWSVHYILMDRVDLPTKLKIEQLTYSWVLRLSSFFFSISSYQSSFPRTFFISVSLLCKSNENVDYWHDKPNKPSNKQIGKVTKKTPSSISLSILFFVVRLAAWYVANLHYWSS